MLLLRCCFRDGLVGKVEIDEMDVETRMAAAQAVPASRMRSVVWAGLKMSSSQPERGGGARPSRKLAHCPLPSLIRAAQAHHDSAHAFIIIALGGRQRHLISQVCTGGVLAGATTPSTAAFTTRSCQKVEPRKMPLYSASTTPLAISLHWQQERSVPARRRPPPPMVSLLARVRRHPRPCGQ